MENQKQNRREITPLFIHFVAFGAGKLIIIILPLERNDDNARRRFDGDCIRTVAIWVITAKDFLHNAVECVRELDMFFQYARWSQWIQWRFIHCVEIWTKIKERIKRIYQLFCMVLCRWNDTYSYFWSLCISYSKWSYSSFDFFVFAFRLDAHGSLAVAVHIEYFRAKKQRRTRSVLRYTARGGRPTCTYPSCYIILWSCIAPTGLILLILRYDA